MPRLTPAALCALFALPAAAADFVPGGNGGTFARAFALPVLGAPQVTRGSAWRASYDVTNEYVKKGKCATECLVMDGETSRLRLSYGGGSGRWDYRVELPLLKTGGGFMDSGIQRWHSAFGLPNDGREFTSNGNYAYHYQRGSTVLLDETEGTTGLGDVTLGLGRALGTRTALRAMAKLPTGDADTLTGGNAGGALWLEQGFGSDAGWGGYVALGGSYNQRGDVLSSMQNRGVAFGGVGLQLPLTESLRVVGQLHAHGRLFHGSELKAFSRLGMPLTAGLQWRASPTYRFDFGMQEDPSVYGSPDFGLYFSLARSLQKS